jgi:tripartite-type tricarboxylate transporter receptor subunit TctC
MMKSKIFFVNFLLAFLFSAFLIQSSARGAEIYPSKPIRLIVPLAAGSAGDGLARTLSNELSKKIGQSIVVDNKPGAGGTIAMAELARCAADGYTLGFSFTGAMVFNMALYKKPGYDASEDFLPIALVSGLTNVLVVPDNSPYKTVADIVDTAKSKAANTISYSSSGAGTSHHISGVLFENLTGTKLLHVPYKSAPQGVMALIANDVDIGFYNLPVVLSQIRSGRLRALAVTTLHRSAQLPEVPTLNELGIKDFEVFTWLGFVAPKKTPFGLVSKINAELSEIMSRKEIRDKLIAQGYDLPPNPLASPLQFEKIIQDDLKKWPPIIRASGASAD